MPILKDWNICSTIVVEGGNMATLSVRIPEKLYKRMKKLAEKTGRTKSSFVRQVLEDNLQIYEDYCEILTRLNDKNARYLKTEEMEKKIGL